MGCNKLNTIHGKDIPSQNLTLIQSNILVKLVVAFVILHHILHVHGPYFAREYGSLGIRSTQGMERSHWQAGCAYQRLTQHGGGVNKSNPMKQLCQWWYMRIQVRAKARIKLGESTISCAL